MSSNNSNNGDDDINDRKRKAATANGHDDDHHQRTPSRFHSSADDLAAASAPGGDGGNEDFLTLRLGRQNFPGNFQESTLQLPPPPPPPLHSSHSISFFQEPPHPRPLRSSHPISFFQGPPPPLRSSHPISFYQEPPPPLHSSNPISFFREPLMRFPAPTLDYYYATMLPPPPRPLPLSGVSIQELNHMLPPPLVPLPLSAVSTQELNHPIPSRPISRRHFHTPALRDRKGSTVPPPYAWATDKRATIHSLDYLLSKEIFTITGDVHCKNCENRYEMGFDLKEKFSEVETFIAGNRNTMHDRAPSVWMNPVLPTCKLCDKVNSARPVIADKKKSINWLFLLLGQMLGCCTLAQLKYFCRHTGMHRTGAKDRVLYFTYLCLCKQLDPKGPFDR